MVQTVQITRTGTDNNSPVAGSLLPGQLAVEMGTPTRLWVGVPVANDPTRQKLLIDAAGNFLPVAGGTMTGPLVLAADATTNLEPVSLQQLNALGGNYLPLAGGVMTGPVELAGDSLAVTPPVGDNDTSIATTAFVHAAVNTALNNVGRNLIHNGLFNIWQRGAGPWTASGFNADRWQALIITDTASIALFALADPDLAAIDDEAAFFALQNVFTGNAAPGACNYVQQSIEGVRTISGKTVTLSFWAKAAAGGLRLGLNMEQYFGSGGTPSAPVFAATPGLSVALTTAWARYSVTFTMPHAAGKIWGTNGDDFTALLIWYSSGATNNVAAGNIGVQSGTVQLWGIQLEIGPTATPLEKIDPQIDLANCQRFYQTSAGGQISGHVTSTASVGHSWQMPVTMRARPTMAPNFLVQTNVTVPVMLADDGSSLRVNCVATAVADYNLVWTYTASADL
jgi:hypothetical protein